LASSSHTAILLDGIAESYDRWARHHDAEAELREDDF
jgi:hypothetical protein